MQDHSFEFSKVQIQQINQCLDLLALIWLTRNTYINFLPKTFNGFDAEKPEMQSAVHEYRQTVLENWDQINDGNGELMLHQFNAEDYRPLKQLVNNNNKFWLMDMEPLVTYLDVKKCCESIGLDPSIMYQYCYVYDYQVRWWEATHKCRMKLFDKEYPKILNHMLNQWLQCS